MTEFVVGSITQLTDTLERSLLQLGDADATYPTVQELKAKVAEYARQSPKIEDQMIWMAMRYALGRRTYAASEAVQYIKAHWDAIDMRIHAGMVRDIRRAMKERDTGDRCDHWQWQSLLDLYAQKTYKGKATSQKVYACSCGGTVRHKTDGHGDMHWSCDSCAWNHYGRIMIDGASGAFDQEGTDAHASTDD
jgi:hypothetical protein